MNITHAIAVHMYIYGNLEKESYQEGGLRKVFQRKVAAAETKVSARAG